MKMQERKTRYKRRQSQNHTPSNRTYCKSTTRFLYFSVAELYNSVQYTQPELKTNKIDVQTKNQSLSKHTHSEEWKINAQIYITYMNKTTNWIGVDHYSLFRFFSFHRKKITTKK